MKRGVKKVHEVNDEFFYGYKSSQSTDERAQRNFLGTFISEKKIVWLALLLLCGFFLLFSKAFFLQVVRGSYYYNLAEGNRAKLTYITSNRGLIYDVDKNHSNQKAS